MRDDRHLVSEIVTLNDDAAIAQPRADIDQRLELNLLFGRIPVGAPQVILFAAGREQRRLAISMHLAAAGQAAPPDIHHDLDQKRISFRHLSDLSGRRSMSDQVYHLPLRCPMPAGARRRW